MGTAPHARRSAFSLVAKAGDGIAKGARCFAGCDMQEGQGPGRCVGMSSNVYEPLVSQSNTTHHEWGICAQQPS